MKGVLAAVAGDAQFRQAEHADALTSRASTIAARHVRRVAVPVERRLVQHRRRYPKQFHRSKRMRSASK